MDITILLPKELWIEIPAPLRYPANLFRTSRSFRSLGQDPHTRSRYLRNRYGTRTALVNAVKLHLKLLQPPKVVSLLLQAGASLPRAVVQTIVHSSTSGRILPELLLVILTAGYEKYGNDLGLKYDDTYAFNNALLSLSAYYSSQQQLDSAIEEIKRLVTTYGFIPSQGDNLDFLASSKKQNFYDLFLPFETVGFNCTQYIAKINDQQMISLLERTNHAQETKDLQYLFDRGFKLSKRVGEFLSRDHSKFFTYLPLLRTIVPHSELLQRAKGSIASMIKKHSLLKISTNHYCTIYSSDFNSYIQSEFRDLSDGEINTLYTDTILQTDRSISACGSDEWRWLIRRFGKRYEVPGKIFRNMMTTWRNNWPSSDGRDTIDDDLPVCLEEGMVLRPEYCKFLVGRTANKNHGPVVKAFLRWVIDRADVMPREDKGTWIEQLKTAVKEIGKQHPGAFEPSPFHLIAIRENRKQGF
ncbi:hypothetical protein HDV00_005698 [Rhizophlyctis rosea]|nr:hypothetical protein HDV00_005698 [Rhizophlyctis rosea]